MARLNHSFVREIIKQKNYRKWWVAEQLGISRRTLHRWLSGETEDRGGPEKSDTWISG